MTPNPVLGGLSLKNLPKKRSFICQKVPWTSNKCPLAHFGGAFEARRELNQCLALAPLGQPAAHLPVVFQKGRTPRGMRDQGWLDQEAQTTTVLTCAWADLGNGSQSTALWIRLLQRPRRPVQLPLAWEMGPFIIPPLA